MIRKQIYIERSQDEKLKRLAATQRVTEAELIRRAIENYDGGEQSIRMIREVATEQYAASTAKERWRGLDKQAWLDELAFIKSLAQRTEGGTYKFNREDAYKGRRFGVPD